MSVATSRKGARRGARRLTAVHGATTRGATYAKARVRDLVTNGHGIARGVDDEIRQITGRRSAAWVDRMAQLAKNHQWVASSLGVLALYAMFVLLV